MVSTVDVFLDLVSNLTCFIARMWLDLRHVALLDCAYCNTSKRSLFFSSVYWSPHFAVSTSPRQVQRQAYVHYMKWYTYRRIRVKNLRICNYMDRTLCSLHLTEFGPFVRDVALEFVDARTSIICKLLKMCTHLERISCILCTFNQAVIEVLWSCTSLHTFQTLCCVDGWGPEFKVEDLDALLPCSNIRNVELSLDCCCLMMLHVLKTIASSRIERLRLTHIDLWDSESEVNSDSSGSEHGGEPKNFAEYGPGDADGEAELEFVDGVDHFSGVESDGSNELDASQFEHILFVRLKEFLSTSSRLQMLSTEQPQASCEDTIVELLQVCSPQVKYFSLVSADYTDWAITTAVRRFAHLTTIDITEGGTFTDVTLHEIATHCQYTLENLYTAATTGFTNAGYRAVFNNCHLLRSLSFTEDSHIDVRLLGQLISLLVHYPCEYDEPDIFTSVEDIATHCPELRQLSLVWDCGGNSDAIDFSVLTEQKLSHLRALSFCGQHNRSLALLGVHRPGLKIVYGPTRLKHPFHDDVMTVPL